MGIKGLGTFVRKNEIDCEFVQPLSDFSGTSWGIDALNRICIFKPIVVKNIMNKRKNIFDEPTPEEITEGIKQMALFFNLKLLEHHITPVWIWDGESDSSKSQTKVERREKRKEGLKKHKILREQLKAKSILELTDVDIKKWKNSCSINHDFPPSEFDKINKFLSDIGTPTITAEDEAENLASSLSYEEKISLVVSNDTDAYPLAARKVYSSTFKKGDQHFVKGIDPWKIPRALKLSWRRFRDLCILFGTDFNDNLPGIGPVKSLKLIREHGSLEEIEEKTKHNLTFMEYKKRRTQLAPYSTYHQLDSHLAITECFDDHQIEMLQEEHSNINFDDYFGSLHDIYYRNQRQPIFLYSPLPPRAYSPSPRDLESEDDEDDIK